MYNQHVERSAGFAGIAFVIVLALAAALPGTPPLAAAAPREIGDYIATHRIMWLISAWLALPLAAFFLWFVVQLRAFLRLAPQIDDGLPTYMLAAGVIAAAMLLVLASLQAAMTYPTSAGPAETLIVRALFYAFNEVATLLFMPLSVMVLATSQSGRRHASLPKEHVLFGYLTGLLLAVASLSIFYPGGFLALGGIGAAAIGLVPFGAWVVWTSLALIRAPRGIAGPA